MEQGEQVAELLGIPKGAVKEHWIIVKRMICNMWQIRSERRGVGIQRDVWEQGEEDWENVVQRR